MNAWVAALDPSSELEAEQSRWEQGELWVTVARPGKEPVRWVVQRSALELAAAGRDAGTRDRPSLKDILAHVVQRAQEGAATSPARWESREEERTHGSD